MVVHTLMEKVTLKKTQDVHGLNVENWMREFQLQHGGHRASLTGTYCAGPYDQQHADQIAVQVNNFYDLSWYYDQAWLDITPVFCTLKETSWRTSVYSWLPQWTSPATPRWGTLVKMIKPLKYLYEKII